jgi:uncharacterized membrane protein
MVAERRQFADTPWRDAGLGSDLLAAMGCSVRDWGMRRLMGDYDDSITVNAPPERLFTYLADVGNLPRYLPRLREVTPLENGEFRVSARIDPDGQPERDVQGTAWMRVVAEGKRLEWGAEGPNNYHGSLNVEPGEVGGTARLTVTLHTEHAEGKQIQDGLAETLAGIRANVEQAEG